jgi:putative flippase GtrA
MVTGHEKKLRFLIAGSINTLVGLSVYPLLFIVLEPMGVGYIKVLIIAQLICITFSFISNKYYVFKSKGNLRQEYIKFFMFHGFYFLLNLICLPVLVEIFKINPIISQTLFAIFIIVTSYFWHNAVTFKSTPESIK